MEPGTAATRSSERRFTGWARCAIYASMVALCFVPRVLWETRGLDSRRSSPFVMGLIIGIMQLIWLPKEQLGRRKRAEMLLLPVFTALLLYFIQFH